MLIFFFHLLEIKLKKTVKTLFQKCVFHNLHTELDFDFFLWMINKGVSCPRI